MRPANTPSRHRRRRPWPIKRIFHAPSAPTYSKSFKAQVIQECSEPGASIANIALGYSLNANLVHKWIRLHTQKTTAIQPAFIPLPSQMLGAGPHAQVRCCDHEFDPVGP
ncbi:transposase [Stutzerimonas balearica]|uniref:transposase n=1 Tax=Stutzerimonas balearica TaxID=74829 RepID=UPI0032B252AC